MQYWSWVSATSRMSKKEPETLDSLAKHVQRLSSSAEALTHEVAELSLKIPGQTKPHELSGPRWPPRDAITLSDLIKLTCKALVGVERDIRAMRAAVERAAEGTYSRTDLEDWVKPKDEND